MNWQDRLIASCACWNEFWERANKLSTDGQKGAAFERLTQLYLQTTPEYRAELRHVWNLREVPPDICKRLDLPSRDEGIDLIACTRHGDYWAIQSKLASFIETLPKRGNCVRQSVRRLGIEKPDPRHRRLLRAHRERPCRRAAEERDERASLHSITSSARPMSGSGKVRPSLLAVLRLTT